MCMEHDLYAYKEQSRGNETNTEDPNVYALSDGHKTDAPLAR